MLNYQKVKAVLAYLKNAGISNSDYAVTGRSAVVLKDYMTSCHSVDVLTKDENVFEKITKIKGAVVDLNDEGRIQAALNIVPGVCLKAVCREYEDIEIIDGVNLVCDKEILKNNAADAISEKVLKARIAGERTSEESVNILRTAYRGVEDITKIRIMAGQRVVSQFKHRLGVKSGEPEEKLEKALKRIEEEYNMLTDGVVSLTARQFKARKEELKSSVTIIDRYTEAHIVESYMGQRREEDRAVKRLSSMLEEIPIWNEYLAYVSGCGPKMGAAIISGLNIEAARYPSSFCKYLGLDVVKDPDTGNDIGRRSWKKLMVERDHLNIDGYVETRSDLGYNAKLKSKMVFVLGGSLMKASGYYKLEAYDPYKRRLENREDTKDVFDEKGNLITDNQNLRHTMARRYMVKQFMSDLLGYWKHLSGGEIVQPYGVAVLGKKAHSRRTFNECLAMAKANCCKPEKYMGPVDGSEPWAPGVVR